MKKIPATVFLCCIVLFSFRQYKYQGARNILATYAAAEKLYDRAGALSNRADVNEKVQLQQDRLYRQALDSFNALAGQVMNDSLRLMVIIKTGLINHYFDSIGTAKQNYLEVIRMSKSLPRLSDSFLFKPYIFLGGILYDEHRYDSAFVYYQQAEQIQAHYQQPLEESQRLYNKLGAMYYETGNYGLAKNYFEKALTSLKPGQSSLMVNYRMNIASILVKMEDFAQAMQAYKAVLPYKVYTNEIWHNLGIISNKQGKYDEALADFEKVNYPSSVKTIELNYNIAVSYSGLHKADSVDKYLRRAILENETINGLQPNTVYGLILKLSGDELVEGNRTAEAVKFYQQALLQFDHSFHDTDLSKNPNHFTGIFSYINLFNTLIAKAQACVDLYGATKKLANLTGALDSYRSAFELTDYVEKTYESDEARLFLNKIKYAEHSKPIDLCIRLYELTHERAYLEEAYLFDQRNKASVLSFKQQVDQIANQGGELSADLKEQEGLKISITRLSLQAAKPANEGETSQLNAQIRDFEIRLNDVQRRLNNNPRYVQLQPLQQLPSVASLQKNMLDKQTALLSFHLSKEELLVFVVTSKNFNFYRQPIGVKFHQQLNSFLEKLHSVNGDEASSDDDISKSLYAVLIKSLSSELGNCNRMIIIPDDELNALPFEALKDDRNHYLLESYDIQYQYSTALLNLNSGGGNFAQAGNLAFAPFAAANARTNLSTLPYSKDEISNLPGKIFINQEATKLNFLEEGNHSGIIHLATHAMVDNESPMQSYISFYPTGTDSTTKLYAREIYNLRLDSTKLVILSACETGAGQLEEGEGLMSLSRAFAYAGCENIITSLWKAEDKTTAFLTGRLHYYLQKDYSIDEALRKSKLDLLKSDEIAPRYKLPNYWAHLVFIGQYQPRRSSSWLWWISALIGISIASVFVIKRRVSLRARPGSS